MIPMKRGPDTNPAHLERWLGADTVARLSREMGNFPWPIAVDGVPGAVYAMPGGGFSGRILGGQEASALDRAAEAVKRYERTQRARLAQMRALNTPSRTLRHAAGERPNAFADLGALIAAATGGKGQQPTFQKASQTAVATGNCTSLWGVGNLPAAGSAGAAAPGGTAHTSANTGALQFANPTNANTAHFVAAYTSSSVINNTLLLCDRLFSVAKTINSTATEAVTGTFSRYQSGTATAEDYIGGNFCYPETQGTTLANTAHNWTVCQYTDQDSNATQSFVSTAGIASATTSIRHIDLATYNWFLPFASGDVGVKALTQMQCSAAVATGVLSFVVAHPIAFMPHPIAALVCVADGINTAFNLTRIYDNACLYFIEMPKPATTSTTYSGRIHIVAE